MLILMRMMDVEMDNPMLLYLLMRKGGIWERHWQYHIICLVTI